MLATSKYTDVEKDLSLLNYTLENLQEAVFWIDSDARILYANYKASEMSGYSKKELEEMRVFDLNEHVQSVNFPAVWERLKKEKKVIFDVSIRKKTGESLAVEVTQNYIEFEGKEFTCSIIRDVRKRRFEEELLRTVSEATSGLTGNDYFLELAKRITAMIGMRYAFVAECADESKSRMRTIVFVDGKLQLDNVEYNTSDSACSMMMNGNPYFIGRDAHKYFRGAMGIEAYVGAPIISPVTGEILGHIAATDPSPVTEEKNQTAILKIFASRAGAEIERMHAERQLEKKNAELQLRLKENELYRFTMENLRDAVYWLNKDGEIIEVNAKASQLSGYSKEELSRMTVFDLNESFTRADWPDRWQMLKSGKKLVFDAVHRHKDGHTYEVEITQNFLEFEGMEYTCSIVRDVRLRRFEEELLRTVSEATSGLTGTDFLVELAKHITLIFSMRYALITECANEEKTRLRTLCYVDGDKVLDNIEYSTKDIPCEIIMEGKDFFMAQDLQIRFPKEKGIESYVGVPIYSSVSHEVIGHIIAFDSDPISDEKNQTAILKIFAARAGAEIERLKAQKNLEIANTELQQRLKEIEELKNRLQQENVYLQEEIKLNSNFDNIISKSKNFHKVLLQVEQVASTDATVLILGESGTGKELLARAVHNLSRRSNRPLVKVNCAALPANLIESELFGHERGAFTGATERKIGRFELADGGTIFLDELGELPIELQAKLLRVLQEGEFERLGNSKTMKVNVRVIAATNRDLAKAMEKNEFREDLYYRLNVFPVVSPPLRDRKEDIPLLVKHFCQKHEMKIGKKINHISGKAIEALMKYDWPGNIRELENLIERALILSPGDTLEYGDWIPSLGKNAASDSRLGKLEDVEREHIIDVLNQTNWRVSGEKGAAKILGLNATTLEARMKKLGIKREK